VGLRRVVAICACSLFAGARSGCSPAKEGQSEAKSAVEELIKTIEVRETELGLNLRDHLGGARNVRVQGRERRACRVRPGDRR
jgi:hypothetical protein